MYKRDTNHRKRVIWPIRPCVHMPKPTSSKKKMPFRVLFTLFPHAWHNGVLDWGQDLASFQSEAFQLPQAIVYFPPLPNTTLVNSLSWLTGLQEGGKARAYQYARRAAHRLQLGDDSCHGGFLLARQYKVGSFLTGSNPAQRPFMVNCLITSSTANAPLFTLLLC